MPTPESPVNPPAPSTPPPFVSHTFQPQPRTGAESPAFQRQLQTGGEAPAPAWPGGPLTAPAPGSGPGAPWSSPAPPGYQPQPLARGEAPTPAWPGGPQTAPGSSPSAPWSPPAPPAFQPQAQTGPAGPGQPPGPDSSSPFAPPPGLRHQPDRTARTPEDPEARRARRRRTTIIVSVAVGVPLLALGLLVAAGIGLFAHQQTKADSSAVRADLRLVATEVATYWADASDVPPVLARQDGQYYLCSADSDCPASFYASTPASQGVELRLKDSAKDAWCLEGRIEGGDWEVSMGPLSGLREGPCP